MNQTDFSGKCQCEVFIARHLAQRFNMQRNTASHYLNQLVAQGVLQKINTRPVYFLHKQAFSQQFTLSRNEYASVAELLAHGEQVSARAGRRSLFPVDCHNESLEAPGLSNRKPRCFYPDGGLPLLDDRRKRHRESYPAQLMHEYAIACALLSPDAPFISSLIAPSMRAIPNCWRRIFGYVKGARLPARRATDRARSEAAYRRHVISG